jgi:hypothetical protein
MNGDNWLLEAIEQRAEERATKRLIENAKLLLDVLTKTASLRVHVSFSEGDGGYLQFGEEDILAYVAEQLVHVSAPDYSDDPNYPAECRAEFAAAFRRLADRIEALPLPGSSGR